MDDVTLQVPSGRYLVRPGRRLTVRATVIAGSFEVIAGTSTVRRLGPGDSIGPADLAVIAGADAIRAMTPSTIVVVRPPAG